MNGTCKIRKRSILLEKAFSVKCRASHCTWVSSNWKYRIPLVTSLMKNYGPTTRHCHSQNTGMLIFRCEIHGAAHLLDFMCLVYECSHCSKILKHDRQIHQKNALTIETGSRRHVIHAPLTKAAHWAYSCCCNWLPLAILYKACRPPFTWWSVWRSSKTQNVQLVSSGTLLGSGRSRKCLFAPCAQRLGASSGNLVLTFPR